MSAKGTSPIAAMPREPSAFAPAAKVAQLHFKRRASLPG